MLPCDQGITASILETSLDAIFTIRDDGIIIDVNAAATRMFGWSKEELIGRNISSTMPSPMRERHDSFLEHFSPERGITHILGSGKVLLAERRDGSTFPVEVGISTFMINGERFFTGFVRDMSERQSYIDHLHHIANHDSDTGILNYRGLMALFDAKATGGATALYIQLNGFRRIVAAHGRKAGDQILKTTAERLQQYLPAASQGLALGRVGEAAFALFTDQDALLLTRRCQTELSLPIRYAQLSLQLTVSIGLSSLEGSAAQRLRDAMTACENLDRLIGGIQVFSNALSEQLQRALYMESRLHKALDENALRMLLQPKLDLLSETIVGAEALVRWQDAELGLVSPVDFIPIAERTGLINAVTDWMLAQGLSEIRRYEGSDLSVAVNFSSLDFRQPDVTERVALALEQAQVEPAKLEIELTETIVADHPATTAERMRELKALGVALSLDDFGTGYSSMSYLCQFPLDTLKIDASFVRETPGNPDANAIATAIGALARALDMSTVAEGVETRAQADFLKSQSINLCQGFLFSRPLPPDAFHALVDRQIRTGKTP